MPPPLAVSLGDPAGVGPELVAEAYVRRHEERLPPFFVCGGLEAVLEAARTRGHSISATRLERPPAGLGGMGDALPFLGEMTAGYRPGTPDDAGGRLALESLDLATRLAVDGLASGVVTGPIAKAELAKVGFGFPGQTEFVAAACGVAADDAV